MVQHSTEMMSRLELAIQTKGKGLEIAPYFDPCLSKDHFDVLYTDYIDNEEISRKAAENPGSDGREPAAIDFVWNSGSPLYVSAPREVYFDFVVASHVMEHVPNPVGWLNELLSVTKVGGKIALFLPSRRFNVDCYRNETTFGELVKWWIEQPAIPTTGQILDFMTNSIGLIHGDGVAWTHDGLPTDGRREFYSDEDSIDMATNLAISPHYLDVHCTVWSAESFRSVIERLEKCGIVNAEVSEIVGEECEFLAILTKSGEPERTPPPRTATRTPVAEGARLKAIDHKLEIVLHEQQKGVNSRIDQIDHQLSELRRLLMHRGRPFGRVARNFIKRCFSNVFGAARKR